MRLAVLLALIAPPALADGPGGDAEAGSVQFARQCTACHVLRTAEGEVISNNNARTGPNLFGVLGRTVGDVAGYNYGDGLMQLRDDGAVWDMRGFYARTPTPMAPSEATR